MIDWFLVYYLSLRKAVSVMPARAVAMARRKVVVPAVPGYRTGGTQHRTCSGVHGGQRGAVAGGRLTATEQQQETEEADTELEEEESDGDQAQPAAESSQ